MTHHRDDRDRRSDREARWESCGSQRRHRHRRRSGRKGRILHTRISEELSEDIRRLAEDLRVPASNLVRNVLEDVFSAMEQVSEDMSEVFEDVLDEASEAGERLRRRQRGRRRARAAGDDVRDADFERPQDDLAQNDLEGDEAAEDASEASREAEPPLPDFPDVLGWQPLRMNRAVACAGCERGIERGEPAHLGITGAGISRTTALCEGCVERL